MWRYEKNIGKGQIEVLEPCNGGLGAFPKLFMVHGPLPTRLPPDRHLDHLRLCSLLQGGGRSITLFI